MTRVAAGRDFQGRVMSDTASTGTGAYAPACFLAVTEDGAAPADADTALAGELTGGGFARVQATYAKTAGSSSYTLTRTLTSSDATARTIRKLAVFNAPGPPPAGTMVFETLVPNPPTLIATDQVALTETVNL